MYFGSLLVGYYGPNGLLFAGRVGTGFSEKAFFPKRSVLLRGNPHNLVPSFQLLAIFGFDGLIPS